MQVTYTRSAPARATAQGRRLVARLDPPALAAWTLAFTLVSYLALRGGGYDTVVRSEVGVAIWWIVLLGAAAGVLPTRFRLGGLVAIGLLAGFTAWIGLAVTWSESAERSVVEPDSPEDLIRFAERLQAQRPLPAPAFRGRGRAR